MPAHRVLSGNVSLDRGLAALLLLVAASVYFVGLDGYPLLDPDEGRYAEIPREMLESRDFIIPRLNYVEYFEKPPLFYWCTAGVMALFGVHEWAVRTVPALAGWLTVLLILVFGWRFFSPRVGLLGGWIYLTSIIPLILARLPIIDGLFTLFLTATWMAWWVAYRAEPGRPGDRWYLASWALMGMAVMTKGIAAIALTGVIVLVFLGMRSEWQGLRSLCWIRGLLLFSLIVLPWHLAAGFRHPEFFHFYVVVQHFQRLASEEHARPFWHLMAIFPFGMLCWTAFFFPAVRSVFEEARTAIRLPWRPRGRTETWAGAAGPLQGGEGRHLAEEVLFLAIWVGAVVGLFSLSRSKLIPYILPAYPAAALLMAHVMIRKGLTRISSRWCAGITAILLLTAIPVLSWYVHAQEMLPPGELKGAVRGGQIGLFLGALILGWSAFKGRFLPWTPGLPLLFLVPAMLMGTPVGANYRKVGGLMKGMPSPLPRDIRVAEWRTFDQGLSFYTRRRTILIDNVGELEFGSRRKEHREFFLTGEEELKRLAGQGPLLVNLRPGDWPRIRRWGLLRMAAANSTNVMAGNEPFFRLAHLEPWPDDTAVSPPLLLPPRPAIPAKGP